MQTLLTIAGFDPSSGAGVTADLMVFAAHSLFGTACITSLTVQSTLGVRSSHPISAAIVGATLDCLDGDLPPAGIKIGMLATEDNAIAICDYLEEVNYPLSGSQWARVPIVLDPVMRSTSGSQLLSPGRHQGPPRAPPPARSTGSPPTSPSSPRSSASPVIRRDDIPHAARALQAQVAQQRGGSRPGIFATGGHLDPPDDFLLAPAGRMPPGSPANGSRPAPPTAPAAPSPAPSSAAWSSATPRQEAALAAKRYVAGALRSAVERGSGHSPVNHLWTRPPS